MPSCWTCSAAAASSSVLATAAIQQLSPGSGLMSGSETLCSWTILHGCGTRSVAERFLAAIRCIRSSLILPDGSGRPRSRSAGGARAGRAGDGLMLSRTQPRPPEAPHATLAEIQAPIIDAYLAALPPGREPLILGSRSVFV